MTRQPLCKRPLTAITAVAILVLTAGGATAATLESDLRELVARLKLTAKPVQAAQMPAADTPMARLGKQLFFSKNLSGNKDAACASCHHPVLAGGDGLSLAIGTDSKLHDVLGPGRKPDETHEDYDGGPNVPRNSPTTFNVGLWQRILFHDGRIERTADGIRSPLSPPLQNDPRARETLVATQALFPVTSRHEMRGQTFVNMGNFDDLYNEVADRLRYLPNTNTVNARWMHEFKKAFADSSDNEKETITYERIADSLGEYQRSQVFVDSPWAAWVSGDEEAINDAAKRGAKIFFSDKSAGGASCVSCHSGATFSDEDFHVLAMPQIGRGKRVRLNHSKTDDLGRYHASTKNQDQHKFRTPSLLNVAITGPWSHAGAYTSLEAVIRHHLDPVAALTTYDVSQIDPMIQIEDLERNKANAIASFKRAWPKQSWPLHGVTLSKGDVDDLVEFLHALTDPCTRDRDCLKAWLPEPGSVSPDDQPLIAVDQDGQALNE